jgi:RNA polymerase sigma-70 factor (ECF subfamily)
VATRVDNRDVTTSQTADPDGECRLIERAKTDPEAFGSLFETHYDRILTYTYRSTLDFAVAEELTSNTFFKALRGLPRYRRRVPFAAWLYRIATNEVRIHWRSQRRRRAAALDPRSLEQLARTYFESPAIEAEEDRQEKMRAYARLHELIALLPERYRSVILLRFFEDLSYEAMAHVLGKRIGTVKSLVHRGLRRLRVILEQDATFRASRHCDK